MAFTEHMTEAQQLAHTLGVVVGAASCCEQVTEERVNSIAVKLRHLISTTANDTADADDASEEFSAALEAGITAVETGRIDPEHAEAALIELEQQLFSLKSHTARRPVHPAVSPLPLQTRACRAGSSITGEERFP